MGFGAGFLREAGAGRALFEEAGMGMFLPQNGYRAVNVTAKASGTPLAVGHREIDKVWVLGDQP